MDWFKPSTTRKQAAVFGGWYGMMGFAFGLCVLLYFAGASFNMNVYADVSFWPTFIVNIMCCIAMPYAIVLTGHMLDEHLLERRKRKDRILMVRMEAADVLSHKKGLEGFMKKHSRYDSRAAVDIIMEAAELAGAAFDDVHGEHSDKKAAPAESAPVKDDS